MDLTTKYMGLDLKNPLVVSASPLTETVDNYKKIEDAGASAIVSHSIFEEQLRVEANELDWHLTSGTESFPEALSYFPEPGEFVLGPEEYLKHIRKAKEAVGIPVIGSINGSTSGGWIDYAKKIEESGADALELNVYFLATNPDITGAEIEQVYLDILTAVKGHVKIPVAMKLNPYFSSMSNIAKRLDQSGADALVLFNRFYQPDINVEKLEVAPNLLLSTSSEMRLSLRWIAILFDKVKASLAATTGIHEAADVVKMILAGADATMLCSTLLKNGINHIPEILKGLEEWMKKHDYASVQEIKGILSQKTCVAPQAFERANYMKTLRLSTGFAS